MFTNNIACLQWKLPYVFANNKEQIRVENITDKPQYTGIYGP